MIIIVGLGNPGDEYAGTWHNAGFLALDALREKLGFPEFDEKTKFQAAVSEGSFGGEKVALVKPITYMNLSGEAASKIANFYKIPSENIWIVYDDIDIPFGALRIRKSGSAGTHNGMKSIVDRLGENVPRFRLGVGEGSGASSQDELKDRILSKIPKKDMPVFDRLLQKATSALLCALERGIEKAMSECND